MLLGEWLFHFPRINYWPHFCMHPHPCHSLAVPLDCCLGHMTCFGQESMDRCKNMLFMSIGLKRHVWFCLTFPASALVVRPCPVSLLVKLDAGSWVALLTYWQWISRSRIPDTVLSRTGSAKPQPTQRSVLYSTGISWLLFRKGYPMIPVREIRGIDKIIVFKIPLSSNFH